MIKNYFAIERNGECIDHAVIKDDNGAIMFEDVMNMTYEELKSYNDLDALVTYFMDATNVSFGGSDEQTMVTLVGEDDVFIWGILIGPGANGDDIRYALVDWKKDGQSYRYEKK